MKDERGTVKKGVAVGRGPAPKIPPPPAAPAPNPDPWMHYTPMPVPGYPCPSCGQHVPGEWSHEDFDDD